MDFSQNSAANLEYFLSELYSDNLESEGMPDTRVRLNDRKHNLPVTCIEIDIDTLSFVHSRYGEKIFELCGITSPFADYIRGISFKATAMSALFNSRVF